MVFAYIPISRSIRLGRRRRIVRLPNCVHARPICSPPVNHSDVIREPDQRSVSIRL